MAFMTSPGCACRPSAALEKTSTPSTVTSKRPPLLGVKAISALGYCSRIAAAKLEARGS